MTVAAFPLDYETKVYVPRETSAWFDLIPELPMHSTLLDATIVLKPDQQFVVLTYRGGFANGRQHERRSHQRVSLSIAQTQALLAKAYPQSKRAEALSSVITVSEVDMSQFSPEAIITGFVSSTGKKHLIGRVDPESTYIQTACSSSYAHGEKATFPIRDLSCVKCRKLAGLPDA